MNGAGYADFCVYDAAGNIVRMGTCSAVAVASQAVNAGEGVMIGDQDVQIAMRLAAQAGEAPTHKIDISGKDPAIMVKPEVERVAFVAAAKAAAGP